MTVLVFLIMLSTIIGYGMCLYHINEKDDMAKNHRKEIDFYKEALYDMRDSHDRELKELQNVIERLKRG
jgi:hypothetical protein